MASNQYASAPKKYFFAFAIVVVTLALPLVPMIEIGTVGIAM